MHGITHIKITYCIFCMFEPQRQTFKYDIILQDVVFWQQNESFQRLISDIIQPVAMNRVRKESVSDQPIQNLNSSWTSWKPNVSYTNRIKCSGINPSFLSQIRSHSEIMNPQTMNFEYLEGIWADRKTLTHKAAQNSWVTSQLCTISVAYRFSENLGAILKF
jgi:hypothetical protein